MNQKQGDGELPRVREHVNYGRWVDMEDVDACSSVCHKYTCVRNRTATVDSSESAKCFSIM